MNPKYQTLTNKISKCQNNYKRQLNKRANFKENFKNLSA